MKSETKNLDEDNYENNDHDIPNEFNYSIKMEK